MGIRDTIKSKNVEHLEKKKSRCSCKINTKCTVLSIVLKFTWRVLLLAVIFFIFVDYITPAIVELYRNFYQGLP